MTQPPLKSIADARGDPGLAARWAGVLAGLTTLWGAGAALYYAHLGLTLSHYDAKAHLVVARRVIDSLTPGWLQLGAVWLPLPHVLNLFPVQVDALYRTGASGVAISVLSIALLVFCAARLIVLLTGSRVAACVATLLLVTNPNLLYLQSTPMTEPLLLGLLALGLMWLTEGAARRLPYLETRGVVALTLACLTRYESWPVTLIAFATYVVVMARSTGRMAPAIRRAASLSLIPLAGLAWFLVHSKVTVGAWFVTGGFYVADPVYLHHAGKALGAVWWGLTGLGSAPLAWAASASTVWLLVLWARRRIPAATLIALAFAGVAALPAYAFFEGHPFRVRYMVPLVAAAAVIVGLGLGTLRRGRLVLAALVVLAVCRTATPFDPQAAMVLEAQWDRPKSIGRRAVTACLPKPGGNAIVMASMGSLAHYMQELSAQGFELRDFLHEGNGDLWIAALERPRDYVRWVLIEEVAEGGDMLAERARRDPRFLDGFDRRCEGGGVVLYGRAEW